MQLKEVLESESKVLTSSQREEYFHSGYLNLEGFLDTAWLTRLRSASMRFIEKSRPVSRNNEMFVLENGHCYEHPKLRRVVSPVSHNKIFWEFASESVIPDLVADVVGPNVRFFHSKLNYKWANGGQRFEWHQDIQAWPHTNYSPVTVGVLLEDVNMSQGPLTVVKRSHVGPLYDLYDNRGNFVIRIAKEKLGWVTEALKDYMIGTAGTVFLLNCRTIHGSDVNYSSSSRPLLLNVYSAADAFPYSANPIPSIYDGTIVRGERARWAHHDPRSCQVPPDWSAGYVGPWAHQSK